MVAVSNLDPHWISEAVRSVKEAVSLVHRDPLIKHVNFHLFELPKLKAEAPYVRTTFPDSWVKLYIVDNLAASDPVYIKSRNGQSPFFWSELELTDQQQTFFDIAQEFGIGQEGYSVPTWDQRPNPSARSGVFSVSGEAELGAWRDYIKRHSRALQTIAQNIFYIALGEIGDQAGRGTLLSPRQLECLSWAGKGKTVKQISQILEISESTVRGHINDSREKLKANNITHAVSKAIALGLISGDTL